MRGGGHIINQETRFGRTGWNQFEATTRTEQLGDSGTDASHALADAVITAGGFFRLLLLDDGLLPILAMLRYAPCMSARAALV